ncbi:MAG: geranylgeranylglycerol-phosphate geranylgeranyltransferase [Nitrososphaerota archaeon]|nr:geranylgeranylglycerol-phosphate geranylgeranyltransferase [Nitrososphaerota archaeon]MDG6959227.1 geranylgeranylglycerol-phosphate geranylgeranyltransferase [Nitrososphaerota archaeon]MDG6972646.1 geranylgeranylglycerol-phosphate geranylgeranyltransferase [Nitrososphaerota archaeon]MDG6976596.1 geranylgeranylglycerol-phosphate geranylgeranyltransferase [Nitrososphaerota archaeon]MDG6982362.1 geranylgeranylglycerol-phosphate geranylgeranyltransferase [Nitrososphaerota archaeon]
MDSGGAFKLIRPINCAMIGFAVIVGAFVSRPPVIPAPQLALGFLTGFFICAYSMVVNDVYDADVDRVNRPGRPIPSGRVSMQDANRLSAAALAAGLACSVLSLNPLAVALAVAYAFLSWLYNSRAKKTGLAGNVIVASSLAIPFIYGGAVAGGAVIGSLLLMMALTAFFSGVGREVVKAMADVEGDAKRNINSVARSRGLAFASWVGAIFFILAVFTSWVPLLTGLANEVYSIGVVVPDAIFAYLAAAIVYKHEPSNALRVKNIALAGMTVGLLVFIGGAL